MNRLIAATGGARVPEAQGAPNGADRAPSLRVGRSAAGRLAGAAVVLAVAGIAIMQAAERSLLTDSVGAVLERPWLLAAFAAAYSAAFWLRAEAWLQLLPGLGRGAAFSILQSAMFVNHLLPVKGGELLRPYLAGRRGVAMADAAGSTVVARVIDYAALFAIAAILIPGASSNPLQGAWSFGVSATVLAAAIAGLAAVRQRTAPGWVAPPVGRLWGAVHSGLRGVTWKRAAGALALSAPSWLLESAVVMVAASLAGSEIGFATAAAVTAFTLLFQVFHFAPGGIGVYEASMTGGLAMFGMSPGEALAIAVLTHGLKFAYAFTVSAAFAAYEGARLVPALRGRRAGAGRPASASRFEVVAARLWNVLNEGKPFTPVFVVGVLLLLGVFAVPSWGYWLRFAGAIAALAPLFVLFYRFAFPLRLRWALWCYLLVFAAAFRYIDPVAAGAALGLYFTFTVVIWGTVYYHLRIGTSWLNFTRFWRLVIENPDSTSGNFLEQAPKFLLLILAHGYLMGSFSADSAGAVWLFTLGVGVTAVLAHQWFFTWAPALPLTPTRARFNRGAPVARRVIAIVIDGCRADRMEEARTPFLDRLRTEGTCFTDMRTVYPARTVTAFSSMLTGASPRVHGMSSNFVPRLGVKCESVFDALRSAGKTGRLVGIAHLIDAFGHEDVRTVSAVNDNDMIDEALITRAKEVLEAEAPDLLVLQLLSVDQTGHSRGSYHREYVEKIEATDRVIESFLGWCAVEGYLENATVLVTSDHGQGIGIGGHGHLSEPEQRVPCILWGEGVRKGVEQREPRYLIDVAPTITRLLGAAPPGQSTGRLLIEPSGGADEGPGPVAVVIPAYNEAESLGRTLARVPRREIDGLHVIVVDDGSTDGTAEAARALGAETVVSHGANRGLGAALRTGLEEARRIGARAAVYVDADGEYDPAEMGALLGPVESGEADYVLGSRYLGTRTGQKWTRDVANRLFTGLLSVAAGRWISDGQTGFRAFSKRALETAEIVHDYNYAQVLTLDLLHKGMRLAEVPISWRARTCGKSFVGWEYLWRVPAGMAREMWRE